MSVLTDLITARVEDAPEICRALDGSRFNWIETPGLSTAKLKTREWQELEQEFAFQRWPLERIAELLKVLRAKSLESRSAGLDLLLKFS